MKTIPIPEGLEIPADAAKTGTMEVSAEFTIDQEAGTMTLISVGGVALGDDSESESEDESSDADSAEDKAEAGAEGPSIMDFVKNQRSQMA